MNQVIDQTSESVENLEQLVLSHTSLKKNGYVVAPLTTAELIRKSRCVTCGKNPRKVVKPPKTHEHKKESTAAESSKDAQVQNDQSRAGNASDAEEQAEAEPLIDQCYWHPHPFQRGAYPCCNQNNSFAKGCCSKPAHQPEPTNSPAFITRWTFYRTPSPTPNTCHRQAVALDCEMGAALTGESELIRLSLIDYFTGEVLINSLVYPDIPLAHCNTRWSGVRMRDLREARANNTALLGRDHARKEVWSFVAPWTIVVLHGGTGDMSSLRWIHPRVVDTVVIERCRRERVEGMPLSLKKLCESRLGLLVQQHGAHCSLEDARACRVLANYYAEHSEGPAPPTEPPDDEEAPEHEVYTGMFGLA